MQTEKRARYLKRVRRRASRTTDTPRTVDDKQVALRSAAAEKTARLRELEQTYAPKITELHLEWAEKRKEIWADYEERKRLIRQATLLKA